MTSASRKFSQADARLDALFDYSRVRPQLLVCQDDDDDDDDVKVMTPAQASISGRPIKSADGDVVKGDEAIKEVVEDDDWLLPPPPMPFTPRPVFAADPALLKIRQQKEELQNILQASMRNSEEASRLEAREAQASLPTQLESGKRESGTCEMEAPPKRQKILLMLQGESGQSQGFRISVDEKLDKVFSFYANKVANRPKSELVFRFDGQQLDANKSPKDFELEDEDIVEVFVKKAR